MNKRKKIDWFSIVLSDTQAGGSEQQQIQLFQHLYSQGNTCLVLCLTSKSMGCWEFMEQNNGRVLYFPFSKGYLKLNYLLLYIYLPFIFLSNQINYSFTTQTLINTSVGLFKKIGFLRHTKVIVRESNSIFELLKGTKLKRYEFAYKLGYSKVDLVICQTSKMKNQLVKALPWLSEKVKISVIDNPINMSAIHKKSKEEFTDLHYKPFLVAAGSLHPKKGFDILIESFRLLLQKQPELNLLILGEGAERENLNTLIKKYDLEEKVFLHGFVKNVFIYFKNANACVMSSRIEGFPNVLLQMMSQNTKVISTLSAGGIDAIPNIYTSPTENVVALTEVIHDSLEANTSKNRLIFDNFLKSRSIDTFVKTIMKELKL